MSFAPLILVAALSAQPETTVWSARSLDAQGDAYAAAGRHGQAILSYERAQMLAPRDAAVAARLTSARESAGLEVDRPTAVSAALHTLSTNEWSLLALAAALFAGLGALGVAWRVQPRLARAAFAAGAMLSVGALGAAVAVAPAADDAVVVTPSVARIAPFEKADEAFAPAEGATVRIEQLREGWAYVREGERAGWLPQANVERIVNERGG